MWTMAEESDDEDGQVTGKVSAPDEWLKKIRGDSESRIYDFAMMPLQLNIMLTVETTVTPEATLKAHELARSGSSASEVEIQLKQFISKRIEEEWKKEFDRAYTAAILKVKS